MIFRNHFLKKGKMSEVPVPKIGKTQGTMFAYSWHLDDEQQEVTVIRIYGLNEKNENVCLIVSNFTPYVYIELPYNIDWDNSKAQLVASKIDSLMGDKKPLVKCLMFKKRLYYASKRLFPYLFCSFSSTQDIRQLSYRINKPLSVPGLGYLPLKVHESNASPILQLVSNRQIPTAGWISFLGKKYGGTTGGGTTDVGLTHCTHEYSVSWKDLSPVSSNNMANPLIMSFDLEVNSSVPTSMPNADRPEDKIFQISAILGRQGSKQETYQKFIISLGNPNPEFLEKNITIIPCKTEEELLMAYTDLLQKYQPNIVIGYNIFGFDIPYMIARAKLTYCIYDFDKQGMYRYSHAKEKTIEWSSSAYKNQSFQFLDVEGRIFVDLLPIVKRDYKMSNYKLSTISAHFLGGQTKDPLDARGIFKCYKLGMKGDAVGRKALSVCAKYCVQDSFLVLRLFEVLTTWVALCEMSKVTNVQIFSLFTQGQQLKVFSQVYKKCTHENTVVERNAYIAKSDDHYVGATVFPPVPGIYDKVVPFDFSSLYPTTIIANNISWDTFVQDDSIPDSECHVMEWNDHISCVHDPKEIRKKEIIELLKKQDVILKELRAERDKKSNKNRKEEIKEQIADHIRKTKPLRDEKSALMKSKPKHIICAQRRYRWLKAPMGVLPEILSDLLKSRASTKKELKAVKAQLKTMKEGSPEYIEKSVYADVLDQRQNALKISANSGYGILGTKTGYLPLMTGAMCTTYRGRKSIEMAAESIQKDYGGVLVYGDSVTADTPILVKYPNGSINIQTIDTLGEEWVSYDSFKQGEEGLNDKEQSSCNLSVWTSKNGVGKWSKINRVIRHKTNKKLYRVLTHTGCVDVTEDHSLLRENGEQVKPADIKVGESLLHSFPDSFEEFDTTIVEGVNKGVSKTYDLKGYEAFVWGTFLGCGSSSTSTSWQLVAKERKKFRVVHKYLSLLEPKIKFVVKLEKTYYILVPTGDKEDIKLFTEKYRQLFYDTKRHCTIVPYPIFNTTKNNKELFIHGYMYGCSSYSFPIISLENKLLAQGLYVLLKSVGKNMYISLSNVDTYRLIENKDDHKNEYKTAIKKILPLPETMYTEYVYDLETESGVFHAGIGELILKNTDSNYVSFPELKTAQECWDYSVKVASEVSKLFPPPMSLAFEEKIYWRFFILTKKRYMSLECDREGKLKKEISKKGVLLQRRDNCAYVRKVYGDVVMMLFNKETMDNIFYYIIEEINKLCGNFYPVKDFIVTKSIGTVSNLDEPVEGKDKKGKTCYKCGDYTVKKLPEDEKKREAQFRLKDCSTKEDYYLRSLPAIAQLAEKMRGRGELVSAGSRIEYLITTTGGHKAKQYVKVEDSEYFARHRESLDIDYMYYLKQLATPLDQVLDIFLKESEKGFVMNQYKYRLTTRTNMLEELKSLFSYKIVLKK